MSNYHLDSEKKKRQLELGIYYLPIVGIIPSLWTLSRKNSDRGSASSADLQHQKASRLSIKLTLIWLCAYGLLSIGSSQGSELVALRLLYTNALVTTGYFLVCLGLILRLRRKS
ncbi:MAG: hypothetical protein AB4206_19230 [Xenococcaceae cyanobacterium]